MTKIYTLKKSQRILHASFSWFKKTEKKLSEPIRKKLENDLRALEKAVFDQDKENASTLAKEVEELTQKNLKKSALLYAIEIGVAIIFALLIATVVRQMWFELYEIPTGSMRPSFREQDRLTVTKTSFGLNVPLETKHFYFDPSLAQRGKVVIFSGANIPSLDDVTKYFGVIPYTKRYIKRLIGKPGDSLYFYGGQIYGVDKSGNPLNELLEDPWMKKLEHIPFISFEGEWDIANNNTFFFKHMGEPIGRLNYNSLGTYRGEININGKWVKDRPINEKNSESISSISDFWGIGNFAMARLLTRQELEEWTDVDPNKMEDAKLYLQLRHSPNLTYPPPRIHKEGQSISIQIPTFETIIPLKQEHLDAITDHLYTSRFVIRNGRASQYNVESNNSNIGLLDFTDVPDGTYEFVDGKAEKVGLKGWTTKLPEDHPLNKRSVDRIKELFNFGINFPTVYTPRSYLQRYYPHRYAYYRDGDLYLLGAPILKKEDPILQKFIADENNRESKATTQNPYHAFADKGPPLKNGKIDVEFIRTFGVKIPEKHYFALGDNHAMSKDSRLFGFVPEDNIQGAPSLLLWPPGHRWGFPPQTPYPLLTAPRLILWGIIAAILLTWYLIHRRRMSQKLFPDQ